MKNIQDLVAKTTKELILDEPFYGLFLIGINKQFSKRVPTAGVSKHGIGMQLTINPEFYTNLSLPT